MTLDRLGGFQPGKRVLHLAPELGLARKLTELSGEAYQGADLDVERYKSKFIKMRKLDLCTDLGEIPDASYDMILHSHVLEHVPCSVETVLHEMDRILAPGGIHFLSVPIRGEKTVEDLSPDLTDAERLARFGQEDHMRIFGSADLQALLTGVWGPGEHLVEPIQLFKRDDLRRAVIPTVAWQGVSGHSIFHYQKGARPLLRRFRGQSRKKGPGAATRPTTCGDTGCQCRTDPLDGPCGTRCNGGCLSCRRCPARF
ncbi:methyltransferase domain-containing protein [Sulfitobacter porphyrae]|uniref:Methyltransferase domain-containing protein n=1 Tax=Sulfitobacter porphyrae TaxID=1246864 RepID=A0ABW2B4W3_9RHOB